MDLVFGVIAGIAGLVIVFDLGDFIQDENSGNAVTIAAWVVLLGAGAIALASGG